jgi:two-component system, sensor histidine kinase and response regulator
MCQQLLCRVLRAADCECTAVGTGAAAVELLLCQKQHPAYSCDLVFMAVHITVMSGIAATTALKQALRVDCPPKIGLTADTLHSTEQQCLKAGMKCVIHKPATQAQIRAAVVAHVDFSLSEYDNYPSVNSFDCSSEQ